MSKGAFVYILTNKKNGTLYIGMTTDLIKRVYAHKNKVVDGFSKTYDLTQLVWYQIFDDIENAALKEKQMKKWKRDWKIRKINEINPNWDDLYSDLLKRFNN